MARALVKALVPSNSAITIINKWQKKLPISTKIKSATVTSSNKKNYGSLIFHEIIFIGEKNCILGQSFVCVAKSSLAKFYPISVNGIGSVIL